MSGLFENSPKNSTRIVRKLSQKFSSDCPKTVWKIQPELSKNNRENSARTIRKQSQKFLKIPSPSSNILELKFTASQGLKENPKSLNDLYTRNIQTKKILYLLEFDETPVFWYSCIALITWTNFTSCINENP